MTGEDGERRKRSVGGRKGKHRKDERGKDGKKEGAEGPPGVSLGALRNVERPQMKMFSHKALERPYIFPIGGAVLSVDIPITLLTFESMQALARLEEPKILISIPTFCI